MNPKCKSLFDFFKIKPASKPSPPSRHVPRPSRHAPRHTSRHASRHATRRFKRKMKGG